MKKMKWTLLGLFLAIASLLLLGSAKQPQTVPVSPRQTAMALVHESGAASARYTPSTPADCCRVLRLNRVR